MAMYLATAQRNGTVSSSGSTADAACQSLRVSEKTNSSTRMPTPSTSAHAKCTRDWVGIRGGAGSDADSARRGSGTIRPAWLKRSLRNRQGRPFTCEAGAQALNRTATGARMVIFSNFLLATARPLDLLLY